jgi:hypothetical protein
MIFLQQGPAQTVNYMIAGYTVIFGVMLIYLISLSIRRRNLQRDMGILEEIEKKNSK